MAQALLMSITLATVDEIVRKSNMLVCAGARWVELILLAKPVTSSRIRKEPYQVGPL